MIIPLETVLSRAGTLNSPRDWSTPTIEKARPVKMMVGKRVRRSPVQSARAASENPPAWKDARGPAKTIPAAARAVVSRAMRVMKLLAKRNASSLPSFSRYSLNTGMKLAEMAEAKIASKKLRGTWLATKKASATGPVPK